MSWFNLPYTEEDRELEYKWRTERGYHIKEIDEAKEDRKLWNDPSFTSSGMPYMFIEPTKKRSTKGNDGERITEKQIAALYRMIETQYPQKLGMDRKEIWH